MDFGFNEDTLKLANQVAGTGYGQPAQAQQPMAQNAGAPAEGVDAMGDPKEKKKSGMDLGSILGTVLAFI